MRSIFEDFIFLMQISGLLPYTWSRKNPVHLPVLNIWLLLWSVGLVIFSISTFYYYYLLSITMKTTGIGGIVLFLTSLMSIILCHVCTTTVLCKSKTTAFVLHTLLHMPYHEHDKKINWQGRSELTAQITVCTVFAVFMMIYGIQYPDILNWAECLCLMFITEVFFGRMIVALSFFRVSSKFVSDKLYSFTLDEVSKSSSVVLGVQQSTLKESKSQNHPHTLSTMTEKTLSDSWDVVVQKAMQPLFELQIKVCQIEVIREQLTSNCFELVSFSLLSSVVSLVTCIFAIVSQNWLSGGAPIFVLSNFSLLTYVCYVGHSFTRKVKEAVGILKTLSCRSKNQSIKAQVSEILQTMTPLQNFDMCGWYTLDFTTLITCVSQVVTYLVIVMQVAWTTTD